MKRASWYAPWPAVQRSEYTVFYAEGFSLISRNRKLDPKSAEYLAHILLALSTDDSTPRAMLALVEDTLPSLWECAVEAQDTMRLAYSLVEFLHRTDLPIHAQSIMLVRIGCRVEVQRAIARWFAISLLVPHHIKEVSACPYCLSCADAKGGGNTKPSPIQQLHL
jgi:hypothetical protein